MDYPGHCLLCSRELPPEEEKPKYQCVFCRRDFTAGEPHRACLLRTMELMAEGKPLPAMGLARSYLSRMGPALRNRYPRFRGLGF